MVDSKINKYLEKRAIVIKARAKLEKEAAAEGLANLALRMKFRRPGTCFEQSKMHTNDEYWN